MTATRFSGKPARCVDMPPSIANGPESGFALPVALGLLTLHLVLSPLVFWRGTIEVFEYNKVHLLHAVSIALAALGMTLALSRSFWTGMIAWFGGPGRKLAADPVVIGVLLYLVSSLASTIWSISPRTSILGTHESFLGLGTVFAYGLLFFATRWICSSVQMAQLLLVAPVVAAAMACTYALVQFVGLDFIVWDNISSVGQYVRPFAMMGHPNFLAAFLVMVLPLIAYFARIAGRDRNWPALAILIFVAILSLGVVFVSLSRGAWLALLGSGLVLVVGWFGASKPRQTSVCVGAAVLLLVVVVAALATLGPAGFRESVAERWRHLADLSSRRHIWAAGWQIFCDNPLLGCGLDTFQLAFAPRRTVAYWESEWNVTPTKAHNEVIHILATQGSLGGLAVVVFVAGVLLRVWQGWRQAAPDKRLFWVALLASVVGFCIQDLFSFTVAGCGTLLVTLAALASRLGQDDASPAETLPLLVRSQGVSLWLAAGLAGGVFLINVTQAPVRHDMACWLGGLTTIGVLGITCWTLRGLLVPPIHHWDDRRTVRRENTPSAATRAVQGLVWCVAILILHAAVIRPFQANLACAQGDRVLLQDPAQAVRSMERGTVLNPFRDIHWVKLGTAAHAHAQAARTPAERKKLLEQARQAFEQAIAMAPVNSYHHANLARLLGELARERAVPAERAFAAFDEALRLDPQNAYFLADAGNTALLLGDLARARDYMRHGVELFPRFAPLRVQEAYLAMAEGRLPEAVVFFNEAVQSDWRGDGQGCLHAVAALASVLVRLHRVDEALLAAQAVVEQLPEWPVARFTLARALEMKGRRAEAMVEYQRTLALQPDHRAARDALLQLQSASRPEPVGWAPPASHLHRNPPRD